MPEGDNALSIDSAVDEIMQILGDDDDDAPDPAAEAEAARPIQPPASWKADVAAIRRSRM